MTGYRRCMAVGAMAIAAYVGIVHGAQGAAVPGAETPTVDTAQLSSMEELARSWVDFVIASQQQGAITTHVTVNAESGEVVPFTEVTNDDSATDLGRPLLWAYRIWKDESHLRAAAQLADFFIRAQFPDGGWAYAFRLQPDGVVTPVWQIANFEEWVQSNGLRHLAAVYHLTGDEKYSQAARKAGEVILRAQDPAGWWPWGAAVGPEDRRDGYMKGPTLNDWNLNACMGDCLVLHSLTGDGRYLDALRRAAEWCISAQIEGPTPGWAAQYDLVGRPSWGRFMEPPAADTVFGTFGAGAALLMCYDMTGQARYLQPLHRHLAWLRSIPPQQKGWMWYAHRSWSADENKGRVSDYTTTLTQQFGGTLPSAEALAGIAIEAGEPIIAYHYQMVPVGHPEVQCYLKPLNGHYGSRSEKAEEWLADELAQRAQGPIVPAWRGNVPANQRARARPTRSECTARLDPGSAGSALAALQAWRSGNAVAGFVEVDGNTRKVNVAQGCAHALRVLRQIALAHVALGKASPDIIPMYRPLGYFGDIGVVQPARDWYAAVAE